MRARSSLPRMTFAARPGLSSAIEWAILQHETSLRASLGRDVAEVRTGKEVLVTFSASDEGAARLAAERMGDQLLANPVIEDYEVSIESTTESRVEAQ